MTNDHVRRVEELFQSAMDVPLEGRAQFLEQACAGDVALRAEVQEMLDHHAAAEHSFLRRPLFEPGPMTPNNGAFPQQIGRFRILRKIGEGGMGAVFEAEQDHPRRNVALKIIRMAMASESVRRRFEYEVQILGQLKHPGIAQIYEAGTHDDGHGPVPYFAMEYVQGRSLIDFARDHKLATRERLRLMAEICDAIHHAHQKGVVHRDLKPANILVESGGEAPQPKILDFGVARATGCDIQQVTMHTEVGQIVGTLAYMSPEQVAGRRDELDLRSDVYALGVILFELLADRLPYDLRDHSILEAGNIIREQPPSRLSSVHSAFRGDIETIVAKALEKDKERRYQSASELAADIRRFLCGEPIEAKHDSTWYVLRKTIRRHRVIVASLLVLFLIVAGSAVLATSLMLRARRSEAKSQWNLRDSLVAQARARRQITTVGRRSEALETLSKAAAIQPGVDLRNEVIATLAVPDLSRDLVPAPPGSRAVTVSNDLTQYALLMPDESVIIAKIPDGAEIARIPPPAVAGEAIGRCFCNASFFIRSSRQQDQLQQLEVWQLPEATLRLTITGIPKEDDFDVAPDGRTLAVGRTDHAIHLYDLLTGQETRQIQLDRNAAHLRFDPTGKKLVRYHDRDGEVSVLDLDNGSWSRVFDQSEISYAVAWSPDGHLLAGAQDDLIRIWDLLANRQIAVLRGHDSGVVNLAFSNDSRLLASFGWESVSIIWNLTTLRPIVRSTMTAMTFASDDRMVGGFTMIDGVLRVLQCQFLFQDGYRIVGEAFGVERLRGYSGAVHPSGRIAVAAFVDRAKKVAGLEWFDLARHTVVGKIDCGKVDLVRFDPSGTAFYTTGAKGLVKWPIRIVESAIQLGPPQQLLSETQAEQFDLTANGQRLAIVSPSGKSTLTVIDTEHPDHRVSYHCLPKALNVTISPDGKWAVVSTWHGSGGEVWDLETGAPIARLEQTGGAFPKFSPDGRWLTIRDWSYLKFLHPGTWREAHRLSIGLGSRVGFSHDGRIAAVADNRHMLHLVDTDTFGELALLEPPDAMAVADTPCFIDDATLAVFAGPGALLQLWDLRRIRSTLASMGLDWDHPPIPPAPAKSVVKPLSIEADLGFLGQ